MQNSARLQQLGLFHNFPNIGNTTAISQGKNKTNQQRREDSESEYDHLQDDNAEEDSESKRDHFSRKEQDKSAKASRKKSCNNTKNQTSDATCGVRFQSRKRVFATEPPTRRTKSKKSNAQPTEPSDLHVLAAEPSDVHVPAAEPSDLHVPAAEPSDLHMPLAAQDDGGDALSQSHSPTQSADGHNHVANEDDFDHHEDYNSMADSEDQMTYEEGRWNRGVNLGHGLQRLNRSRCGKLPIIIPEGSIRPLSPIIAAKFATECNIAVKNHVPVLVHWKEYKKRPALIDVFLGSLRAKFYIDTDDAIVRKGCVEMMKNAVRQQRHRLKAEYFDPFPLHLVRRTSPMNPPTSDDEWLRLVEDWKKSKKMEACQKNKDNRALVKLPGTTGSCSYPVFVQKLGGEDDDNELDAFGLFKLTHFSKRRNGYTPNVQATITEMENQLVASPNEDEQPRSPTQVVADVLHAKCKTSTFLQNVGIVSARPRSSVKNVQAQLQVEIRANGDLRSVVNSQRVEIDDLSRKLQETNQSRIRDKEEMEKKRNLNVCSVRHQPMDRHEVGG